MRFVSVCLVIILLVFLLHTPVLAQNQYNFTPASDGQVNQALERIVPVRFYDPHPLHVFVVVKENVTLFFQPSAVKKAEFNMTLAGKRLKEAYLLQMKGDINNSSADLKAYSKKTNKMVDQLEKARSQNQDIENLIGTIAENLRSHESLFYVMWEKAPDDDAYSFRSNFDLAVDAHVRAVMALDNIKPGIRDRFSTTKEATPEAVPSPSPSPSPTAKESSPSVRPRRIIY